MHWRKPLARPFQTVSLLLILCGLALPGGAAAPGDSTEQLNEVTVTGKKLREIRREAVEAEDHFYERFNALNTRDDFDIHCHMDKETGTNIPKRLCRVQFLAEAGARDGREFLMGLTSGFAGKGVNTPNAALQMEWVQRREEYRQAARALLEKDPELMALATRWLRLREQYDQASQQRHKDRIFVFE